PAVNGYAGEREDLVQLRATTLNLIEALVKEGVLSQEGADKLLATAKQQAATEMQAAESSEAQAGVDDSNVVRVAYVPQFVRDEIRDQVRVELREDVTRDVLAQAQQERWGIPDAMPEWTQRIKISGDLRLRAQDDLYSSDNLPFGTAFVDFNEVNDNGGFGGSFLNTDEDRFRGRLRARLGIDGKVTNNLKAGLRVSTGNSDDPVSTNQTMGDSFSKSGVVLDRSYLQYDGTNTNNYPYLTLWGGRMPNPWLSTDLVWDDDLSFECVAGTYRMNLAGSGSLMDMDERDRSLFVTLGGFFLDEVDLSSDDKWLFGGQVGGEMVFDDQSTLKMGIAYYDYRNIAGRRNSLDSTLFDYTAPEFVQKGNSMFEISNDTGAFGRRFGLAPDFGLVNLTVNYDLAKFAPIHYMLSADYVRNVGYDAEEIRSRLEGSAMFVDSSLFTADPSDEQNEGYQLKLTVGWPSTLVRRNWQAFLAYRYLERDAVLDAFTDSDFHLGGTNAKGWMLGGSYGLTENAYLTVRYMSADEINGPPLGIDVLQVDLNAKF
ncbi:MAG: putative porin, partial [Gammaproteobacteria bacterium]|nr:putative porin [Gammaproteobacteria bacterium]